MEANMEICRQTGRPHLIAKEKKMSLFSKKEEIRLNVTGMHCEKCVARVKAALEAVDGVTQAEVDLESETATVCGHGIDKPALVAAVEAIDFGATLA